MKYQEKISSEAKIYFMGIAGTGMAAVAGLVKEVGYNVIGSDGAVYPPTSTLLEDLKIKILTPYDARNIDEASPDLVIVANALSRGHSELEYALSKKIPYTSFPEFLGNHILKGRQPIVVAGTHGKTTTTSLLAFLLKKLGEDPGYLIGGVPRDLPLPFANGKGPLFVIEGDEYDTAFFDKDSKFLHYHPKYLVLNNLEFDHADIFSSIESIEAQFMKLTDLVKDKDSIIANIDDKGLNDFLSKTGLIESVTKVSTTGKNPGAQCFLESAKPIGRSNFWEVKVRTSKHGVLKIRTLLTGAHNAANITQVVALLEKLEDRKVIKTLESNNLVKLFEDFNGVKRRLELLSSNQNIEIYEDFAHHPTAVDSVISGFKTSHPQRRLLVAFEPKNATSRRNIFLKEYAKAFGKADLVYLGKCPEDKRVAEKDRMSTAELARAIGSKARFFVENEDLGTALENEIRPGDAVIFMSAGSFSGVQHALVEKLKTKLF